MENSKELLICMQKFPVNTATMERKRQQKLQIISALTNVISLIWINPEQTGVADGEEFEEGHAAFATLSVPLLNYRLAIPPCHCLWKNHPKKYPKKVMKN